MKYKSIIFLLVLISIFLASTTFGVMVSAEIHMGKYRAYYQATETLLDSLEDQFNWIDRYDSKAIDNYYNAKEAL